MGTSVLLAPFILPFAFYVIIKMMLNPSDFIGFFDVFFTEEAFKAYEETFKYFINGEFAETLIKNLSENFSGYYF
ncbi:MAG: hypothetical protein IJ395_08910 [Clostridia bacterium]|nr:hypothetical protein [Clostridia bacterium]